MNKVSSYERRVARVRAYTLNKFERSGVRVISRVALTAMRQYKQDYISGRLANGLIAKYMLTAENELTDLWVVAYLTGLRQSLEHAASSTASLQLSTAHSKQVEFLRKFLNMTSDEIEKIRGVRKAAMHEEILKISQTAEQRVQKALLQSIDEGEHIEGSVKRLEDAFRKSGLTPKNSFQLEGIVRTNMQIAYSGARWQADQQPEIADFLWGYKYVTVGDDRVRPNHAAMDGVTLPKDHPFWQTNFPPNGWACRCQAIEIFGERDEVLPPEGEIEIDGELTSAEPDQGFAFNPGTMVPMPRSK
jgi:SPP1 gp7 family putative phage head morphogenesis protein